MARRITAPGVSLFVAAIAAIGGAICLGVAPQIAGDAAQARQLAAHGVRVPLTSADFATHVIAATRASGSDSCTLDRVTAHFTLAGVPRTAVLRETHGVGDLPTCADERAAAADAYAAGTALLVDAGDPTSAALAQYVPADAADTSRAHTTAVVGGVLLGVAALFALPSLLKLLRRRRATA